MVSILREWFRERTEKRKTHAKLLYPALQALANKINLGSLPIYLPISNEKWSEEADEHIKSGYFKEVWQYKIERDNLILIYNPMVQDFAKSTTEKIKAKLAKKVPSLIEWNGNGKPPIKYFSPTYLSLDIESVVLQSYKQPFDIDRYCVIQRVGTEPTNGEYLKSILADQYGVGRWKLTINRDFAEGNNESEMLQVKQIVIAILKAALIGESFVKIKKCYEDIKSNDELFVNSVEVILKKIDNDIPLEGKCELFGY